MSKKHPIQDISVSFKASAEFIARMNTAAKKYYMSRSQFIKMCIDQGINRLEEDKKNA